MLLLLLRSADPGPGRPDLTSRITRLSAAGVPERHRAFGAKGAVPVDAALSGSLPTLASTLAATTAPPDFNADLSGALPKLGSSLAGTAAPPDFNAALSGALAPLTGSVDAFLNRPEGRYTALTVAGVPGRWRAFTSKAQSFDATLLSVLPTLASSLAGTTAPPNFDAVLSSALPKLASSLGGTTAVPQFDAALSGTLAPLTGAIAGDSGGTTATLSGPLPKLAGSLTGQHTPPQFDALLSGVLPMLSSSVAGTVTAPQFDAALSGTLGPISGSLDGITGAYAFVVSGSLPGLRGRLFEREPTAIALRFRDVPTVAGFALEVRLFGRAPLIQIAGRVRELTLLGRIVDEDSQRTA